MIGGSGFPAAIKMEPYHFKIAAGKPLPEAKK
jgi:hypothetical protein